MIKPFGKTILVERDKAEAESAGGIIMPDSVKERKINQGVVIALGTDEELYVSEGDVIVVNDFAGMEVEYDGAEYLVLPEEEIICILTED